MWALGINNHPYKQKWVIIGMPKELQIPNEGSKLKYHPKHQNGP
jgi:hypothetical protein